MTAAGDDDLTALREQAALASAAAISARDLDHAFQLQLEEATQASIRLHPPVSSSNAASSSWTQAAPTPPEPSSDASYAFALQAADLALAEQDRRDALACRAAHYQAAASARIAAYDARFARELAAVPEDQWARDGDYFERPLDLTTSSSSSRPLFRVYFKGMASSEAVGARDRDPGLAVLAVAVCGPQGNVVLRTHKPVEGVFVGDGEMLEAMALLEGLRAALELDIRSVKVITDHEILHNHMLGTWRPSGNKLADMINQVLSVRKKFEQCEISLVEPSQVSFVIKLARDSIAIQIAKALSANAKEKRETCTICLEEADITRIHAVEGCAHRFCFPCMMEHVKVKLLHGMLPACPQDGCTTKLSVEGSKIFLSPPLLEIVAQRVREGQIAPSQKIYCPYPKCSALMSLSEVIHPMQESCSKNTVADAATLRKCVKCRGSFCMSCKVPWHDEMSCHEYKRQYPHARPEDARLENLAKQRLWRQCVKCKHLIELSEGCYHMTCVCGHEFCYTCGKEWKEKKATCSCLLWDVRNIIRTRR